MLALLVIYGLNLPFCAGAEGSTFQWRMEEGRLFLMFGKARAPNPFWVAAGSGRLRLGWNCGEGRASGAGRLAIPLWAPLLAMAGLSVWAFWPRRRDDGHCAKCGYDLRGIEGGGVCPECGKRRAAE